jgi:predicted transposase/invertase (TIGR01784 family)
MSLNKYLNPRNDFAFKRIFGTEKNQDTLIHFLNDILGFNGDHAIQSVSFLKTAQDPEIAAKKQSLVDALCKDETGRQYVVEMQIARTAGFEKGAQYYAPKAYSRQLNQGEEYEHLKEIIFLAITDFVMFPDKKEYKSDHVTLDKKTHSHDLKDFHFTFLELPKFTKTIDELESIVEKWAYFFKHAEETKEGEVKKIVGKDPVIERAYEELNRFSWSEIELNTYEQEEKRERDAQAILKQQRRDLEAQLEAQKASYIAEGEAKGRVEGMAEGEKLAQQTIAKKALAQNMLLETIHHLTGLTLAEIKALKASTDH